jgi:hypothetical protein
MHRIAVDQRLEDVPMQREARNVGVIVRVEAGRRRGQADGKVASQSRGWRERGEDRRHGGEA